MIFLVQERDRILVEEEMIDLMHKEKIGFPLIYCWYSWCNLEKRWIDQGR